jgi:hypothetical protein
MKAALLPQMIRVELFRAKMLYGFFRDPSWRGIDGDRRQCEATFGATNDV